MTIEKIIEAVRETTTWDDLLLSTLSRPNFLQLCDEIERLQKRVIPELTEKAWPVVIYFKSEAAQQECIERFKTLHAHGTIIAQP